MISYKSKKEEKRYKLKLSSIANNFFDPKKQKILWFLIRFCFMIDSELWQLKAESFVAAAKVQAIKLMSKINCDKFSSSWLIGNSTSWIGNYPWVRLNQPHARQSQILILHSDMYSRLKHHEQSQTLIPNLLSIFIDNKKL